MNSKFRSFSSLVAAAFLALGLLTGSAQAAAGVAVSTTPDADKFDVRLGGFAVQDMKTSFRLDGRNGQIGDVVDFQKTLGVEDTLNVFRFDGDWRIGARHRIQVAYFDLSESATKTISGTIRWGDLVIPVNSKVDTELDNKVYKINYAYSFYRNPSHEIAGQIGAHVTKVGVSLSVPSLGRAEGSSVTAPLPVIGLEWKAKLSDKFTSQVSYQYFGISLEDDKYSGDLSDFLAVINYRFARNWYLGGGFNRYVLNAELQSSKTALKLKGKHEYNGIILHLGASF